MDDTESVIVQVEDGLPEKRVSFLPPRTVRLFILLILVALGAIYIPRPRLPGTLPDKNERLAAVGRLNWGDRTYLPGDHFQPLSARDPRWLVLHEDSTESFDEYLASGHHGPTALRRVIEIRPWGTPGSTDVSLADLRDFMAVFFPLPVRVGDPLPFPVEDIPWRPSPLDEPRYDGGVLLWKMNGLISPDAVCLLGVTNRDLCKDINSHWVFGQASARKRSGIFSFRMLDPGYYRPSLAGKAPDGVLHRRRAYKLLAHETGHMFELPHCTYYACLMNAVNSLDELDGGPLFLCPVCLRKLQTAIGFNVERRYLELAQICQRQQLLEEVAWFRARRQWLLP